MIDTSGEPMRAAFASWIDIGVQGVGRFEALLMPAIEAALAVLKTPPATVLIKKALKLEKGSGKPHLDKVGKITKAQREEIAKTKMKDLNAANLDAAVKIIAGSARSMGVTVEGV